MCSFGETLLVTSRRLSVSGGFLLLTFTNIPKSSKEKTSF